MMVCASLCLLCPACGCDIIIIIVIICRRCHTSVMKSIKLVSCTRTCPIAMSIHLHQVSWLADRFSSVVVCLTSASLAWHPC